MPQTTNMLVNNDASLAAQVMFDIPRHNLITMAAYQLLGPNARAKVDNLLESVDTPANRWGGWADQIKGNNPPNDQETTNFLQDPQNSPHKPWHYVNLPLGSLGYQSAAVDGFTRNNDIVQMYRQCVLVLKGASNRFSEVNALRWLGHLVGDIHMPLHVGCGFMDDSTNPPSIVTDQQTILNKNLKNRSDTGGNKIKLQNAGSMHSFWDGSLSGPVGEINLLSIANVQLQLVQKIVNGARRMASSANRTGTIGFTTGTPIEDLARNWADESLKIAAKAYKDIRIVGKNGNDYDAAFTASKAAYITKFRPILLKQLKLAARRLADLLNDLFP